MRVLQVSIHFLFKSGSAMLCRSFISITTRTTLNFTLCQSSYILIAEPSPDGADPRRLDASGNTSL